MFNLKLKNRVQGFNPKVLEGKRLANFISKTRSELGGSNGNSANESLNKNLPYIKNLNEQIEKLKDEIEVTREESFLAGYEEGRKNANEDSKREVDKVVKDCGGMVNSVKEQLDQHLDNSADAILKLSLEIAKKILGYELKNRDDYGDIIMDQIRKLLEKITNQRKIVIYLNPAANKIIDKNDLIKSLNVSSEAAINFISLSTLTPGECIVETEDFVIEKLISRQFDNLEENINRSKENE